ncbi:hypothetical protein AVEN_265112-1 [Araneus ventricosus]|uniref:Uncharacterized protein n=1 Tax=Araneus ventricosus TaxID=182803 RepID=A0A4Y2NJU7_ARAVE|nr:hypothetical protein AVEN_265112-1 [Araneus ventricosus]
MPGEEDATKRQRANADEETIMEVDSRSIPDQDDPHRVCSDKTKFSTIAILENKTYVDQSILDQIAEHEESRKEAQDPVEDLEGNMDLLSSCLFPIECKFSKTDKSKNSESQTSKFIVSPRRKVSRKNKILIFLQSKLQSEIDSTA